MQQNYSLQTSSTLNIPTKNTQALVMLMSTTETTKTPDGILVIVLYGNTVRNSPSEGMEYHVVEDHVLYGHPLSLDFSDQKAEPPSNLNGFKVDS